MIQVFKLMSPEVKGAYDSSIPNILIPSITNLRGHGKKLFVRGAVKDIRKYNFTIRIIKVWNSLPNHVINSADIIAFERSLDEHWSNQEIKYENFKAEIRI